MWTGAEFAAPPHLRLHPHNLASHINTPPHSTDVHATIQIIHMHMRHTCPHTDTHRQAHTRTHTHTHARAPTHRHTHTCTHTHAHTHTLAHTRTHTHTHTHTHTRTIKDLNSASCDKAMLQYKPTNSTRHSTTMAHGARKGSCPT